MVAALRAPIKRFVGAGRTITQV